MCLEFYANNADCEHLFFVGFQTCGVDCAVESTIIFYLEDPDCEICDYFANENEVANISQAEPHLPSGTVAATPQNTNADEATTAADSATHANEELLPKEKECRKSIASLSDADSETEEWKQDDNLSSDEEITPNKAKHRKLVEKQLQTLPYRLAQLQQSVQADFPASNGHQGTSFFGQYGGQGPLVG
ncbi:hypothetical protein GQ44DRAFT_697661, partial [Phaeosphaeriaceae sp. PMI808]